MGQMIPNFEGDELSAKLKKDYGYIYDSMNANNYDIRLDGYNILFELVSDNKVVGFAAYFITQPSAMTLTDTYVLPEFESPSPLLDNFLTVFESGSNISIIRPTRDVVEFLVEGTCQ